MNKKPNFSKPAYTFFKDWQLILFFALVKLLIHYGSYRTNISKSENQLVYIRNLIMNKGKYPSVDYDDFTSFFESIEKYDNSMFILVKN